MKKLKLKLNGREMLTKEQMKRVNGGEVFQCCAVGIYDPMECLPVIADNCCSAQGICDAVAWSSTYTNYFPEGGDVECDMAC